MTRVLQISDLHLTIPPAKLCGKVDTLARLRATVTAILEHKDAQAPVEAVVITGDVSHDGTVESYALFRKEIERLDLPFYVIPGNHDTREAMRIAFGDAPYMPKSGRLNWEIELENMHVIGLDTLIEGEGGGVFDDETAGFLARSLERLSAKPALIAMHHPPFDCGIHFMDDIGLDGLGSLADVLDKANCKTQIICGHVHNMIIGSVGNTIAISAPSPVSSFPIDYRFDAAVGFTTQSGGYMLHEWNGQFRSSHIDLTPINGLFPFRV